MKLKDGSFTKDPRFDRIKQFDPRSKKFGIRQIADTTFSPIVDWDCPIHLDQGREGACVGFGIAHELISTPVVVQDIDAVYAKRNIYWEAQKEDPWEGGSYPNANPHYEGTSVLAGVKVAHRLGWMESYYWCFGIDELVLAVGTEGPAVLGVAWHREMRVTNEHGYIRPRGGVVGGHCILCKGVNVPERRFTLHNSWGENWGINGDCYISFNDMDYLLNEGGEAVVFINRRNRIG